MVAAVDGCSGGSSRGAVGGFTQVVPSVDRIFSGTKKVVNS